MKISAIRQQRRDSERVSVFLDEEFWTGMSKRLLEELGLAAGDEIDSRRKDQVESQVVEDNGLGYALARLTDRPLSEAQLAEKLRKRELSEPIIEMTIARCKELRLLDDRDWTDAVIADRRERGHGRRRVEQYLRQAGIDRELADELLDTHFDSADETDEARAVLTARYGDGPLNPVKLQRACDFLVRRGFSHSAARAAASELAMSSEQEQLAYGAAEALDALQRRYRGQKLDRSKAFAYLARRGFSFENIKEALSSYDSAKAA